MESPKRNLHKKILKQSQQLKTSPATIQQKIKIVNTVLCPGVAYSFHVVPYSIPDIKKIDKLIISTTKAICNLPQSTPNLTTQLPTSLFGIQAFSFLNDYIKCIGKQLQDALNDPRQLDLIYKGLTASPTTL